MTTTKKPRRMARQAVEAPCTGVGTSGILAADSTAALKRPTKQDMVLALLKGEGGAPLDSIVEATGWLPHTARAALTGLRKKGHAVTRITVEGETRYVVEAAVAQ